MSVLLTAGFGAERKKPSLIDSLKDWKTLKFILYISASDYTPPRPYILLQRIDADHVVVSTCDRELPIAREILNAEQAEKLVDEAVAIYDASNDIVGFAERIQKLPKEEQDAIKKQFPMGFGGCDFRIEIQNSKDFHSFQSTIEGNEISKRFDAFIGGQLWLTEQKERSEQKEK
jgi:hypothetical protein